MHLFFCPVLNKIYQLLHVVFIPKFVITTNSMYSKSFMAATKKLFYDFYFIFV